MKKTFLIVIAILVAGLLVLGGVYLRLKNGETEPITSGSNNLPGGSLPQGGSGAGSGGNEPQGELPADINPLSAAEALDLFIQPNGDVLYTRTNGQIVRVTNTSSTLVSTSEFADVLDARFSFDGKKMLLKVGSALSPRWSVYDIEKNAWRQIPIEAKDAYWSPSNYQIAYFARKVSSSDLSTIDLGSNNSRPRTYLSLNADDLDLSWSTASRIFFFERSSAMVPANIWRYDLGKGSLVLVQENIRGISMLWGNKAEGILFKSGSNGRGGRLYLINERGEDSQSFTTLTLPSKCSFYTASSSENIICAAPRDTRTFSGMSLPDDYNKLRASGVDDFYVISPKDESMRKISSNTAVDATRLKVFGNTLYFIDRFTKKINRLQIGG